MNLQTNQKGFTIVELLIVIVVIAILAAISIVAYTGIQNNARSSAAASAAASVRDVAEAYNASNSGYPSTRAQFLSGGTDAVAKLPSDITFGTPTGASGDTKTVLVTRFPATGTITGLRIDYWDYKNNRITSLTTTPASLQIGEGVSGTGGAAIN